MSVRIVLVDDQEMYRLGFRMLLRAQAGIEVVGEAGDGLEALALLDRVETDVVLMDVRMPRMGGIEATRRLAAAGGPRVIVLTTFDLDEYTYEAIRAGASGFLLKDASLEELVAAIRHVHDGDAVLAPSTTRRLIETYVSQPQATVDSGIGGRKRLRNLTGREREIFLYIARGFSNQEIARDLAVAEGTVRVHVSRILNKLELRDRAQAVVLAYESGLVSPRSNSTADR